MNDPDFDALLTTACQSLAAEDLARFRLAAPARAPRAKTALRALAVAAVVSALAALSAVSAGWPALTARGRGGVLTIGTQGGTAAAAAAAAETPLVLPVEFGYFPNGYKQIWSDDRSVCRITNGEDGARERAMVVSRYAHPACVTRIEGLTQEEAEQLLRDPDRLAAYLQSHEPAADETPADTLVLSALGELTPEALPNYRTVCWPDAEGYYIADLANFPREEAYKILVNLE